MSFSGRNSKLRWLYKQKLRKKPQRGCLKVLTSIGFTIIFWLIVVTVIFSPLFWQNMTKDETTYADLLHEVFSAHASLQGLPAARAELQYIKDVQLMDGYGCDFYVAKVGRRFGIFAVGLLWYSMESVFHKLGDGKSGCAQFCSASQSSSMWVNVNWTLDVSEFGQLIFFGAQSSRVWKVCLQVCLCTWKTFNERHSAFLKM